MPFFEVPLTAYVKADSKEDALMIVGHDYSAYELVNAYQNFHCAQVVFTGEQCKYRGAVIETEDFISLSDIWEARAKYDAWVDEEHDESYLENVNTY